jgi:hypothetical protein
MNRIVLILVGVLLVAVAGEIVLRFCPVITSMEYRATTPDDPIMRGKPGLDYVYSKGWNFRLAHRGHLNNFGYPALRDYQPGERNIVVVGDSFIEGLMLLPEERLQSYLEGMLQGRARVYGLSRSGSELPQYLGVAHWASRLFKPEAIVFNLTTGDVDDAQVRTPGDYYFALASGNASCDFAHTDNESKPKWTTTVRASALVNYLLYNLRFLDVISSTMSYLRSGPAQPAEVGPDGVVELARRRVAECFLQRVGGLTGLPRERLIFVLSPYMPAVYDPKVETPRRDVDVFADLAESQGYSVVRLQAALQRDYAVSHGRYDFMPVDAHWNGRTHRFAAEAVYDKLQSLPSLSASGQATESP